MKVVSAGRSQQDDAQLCTDLRKGLFQRSLFHREKRWPGSPVRLGECQKVTVGEVMG